MQEVRQNHVVLIADNDKYIRDYLYLVLSTEGYICYTTNDGNEIIELAFEMKPDIVFLDLFLLKISGFEVCRRLKNNPTTSSIPIIIITRSIEQDLKMKCLEAGANDLLLKPLNSLEVKIKTRNFINLKKYQELELQNVVLSQTMKLIENAKREWESIFDCVNDIIILIDQKDTILRINKRLVELMETDFQHILGKKFQDVLKKGLFNFVVLDSGDIELHHSKGRYFNFNIYYLQDFNETIKNAAVIVLQDITNVRRLTKKLENSNKMLEVKHSELEKAYLELKSAQAQILQQEKMASIGQLASGIAHEINNPTGFLMSNLNTLLKYSSRIKEFISFQDNIITAIHKGFSLKEETVEELKRKRKSLKIEYLLEDMESLVKESIEGAERIKLIVQDLKSFSRIDEAEFKLADINEGIESTINILWNELKYKATIKKELGILPKTYCNLGQLNQVFMNLLLNAVQAIEKKGEINIKTWYEADKIYVSISDNGVGIPEDKINRIFEPFFTTKPVGQGTGLGLSIAYDIIRKHRGNIDVRSKVGEGTTFTVKIPVTQSES